MSSLVPSQVRLSLFSKGVPYERIAVGGVKMLETLVVVKRLFGEVDDKRVSPAISVTRQVGAFLMDLEGPLKKLEVEAFDTIQCYLSEKALIVELYFCYSIEVLCAW